MADQTRSWEQLSDEPDGAFLAFATYRDLGELRTVAAAARELKIDKSNLYKLRKKHRWDERARAYDDYVTVETMAQAVDHHSEMIERHARIARTMLEKLESRLSRLNPAEIPLKEFARWLDVAVKLERLSRGEVTDRTESNTVVAHRIAESLESEFAQYAGLFEETYPIEQPPDHG